MSEPLFLTADEVLLLHKKSLAAFGGLEGLRDDHGFASAVEQPKQTYYYGNGDVFDVAAAYMFHLAQAQAFLDGNKRTGVGAGLLFLELNGATTDASNLALYNAVMDIAERRCDKVQLAALLRGSATGSSA